MSTPDPVRRALAAATGLLLAVGVSACSGVSDGPSEQRASPSSAPATVALGERDLAGLTLRRTSFCGELAEGAADRAVGGPVAESVEYEPGDRAEVVPGTTDVAHEFSCGYAAADGSAARAWVFAPPVTTAQARALVVSASAEPGCRRVADAAAFGRPSTALACTTKEGVSMSYRGLFGDAWLACEVDARDVDRSQLVERTEAWCGAVVDALATPG